MTRPPPARVVADLPVQQAQRLSAVHRVARQVALARRDTDYSIDLEALERERSVAEIIAASHGIPAIWVAQARETGAAEQDWHPDTVLRQTHRQANPRRSARRVVDDTARLADMAATAAVREYLLTNSGDPAQPHPGGAEPHPHTKTPPHTPRH
ncbi:hypothetical protein, partial [Nocardia sp. NPDC058497]|uniref:hypothetical protein n=1 Tax=Nocardia sp. NPDC058497 TaxID=3346529 RepID=UPI003665B7DA